MLEFESSDIVNEEATKEEHVRIRIIRYHRLRI